MSDEIIIPNTVESNSREYTGENTSLEHSLDEAISTPSEEAQLSNEEIDNILGIEDDLDIESISDEESSLEEKTNKKKKSKKKRIDKPSVWEEESSVLPNTWEEKDTAEVRESDIPLAIDKQWDTKELAPKGSIPIYEVGGEEFTPGNLDDILRLNVSHQNHAEDESSKVASIENDYDGFIKTHILAVKDASILTHDFDMTLIEPTDEIFSTRVGPEKDSKVRTNPLGNLVSDYFIGLEGATPTERARIIELGLERLKADIANKASNVEKETIDKHVAEAKNNSKLGNASFKGDMKNFETLMADIKARLEDRLHQEEELSASVKSSIAGDLGNVALTDEELIYIQNEATKDIEEEILIRKSELGEFGNCQKKYEELKINPGFSFYSEEVQDLVNKMSSLQFTHSENISKKPNPVADYFHIREKSADFIKKTGLKLENLFESSGGTILNYTKEKILSDQGLAMDGLREITYKVSTFSHILAGDILEKASLKNHVASTRRYLEKVGEDANKASLLMSAEGRKLSLDSFKDRVSLKRALDDSRLSIAEKKRILGNRRSLEIELRAENALKSVSKIDNYYSLKNTSHFNKAVNDFLSRNANGKNIRINTGSFSKSELKKLEKIATGKGKDKYKIGGKTFTRDEASVLLAAKRRNDAIKARRALRNYKANGRSMAFFRLGSRFLDKSVENNDTLSISFRNTRKIKRVSSVMVGIVATTSKFILKKTKLTNKIELGKSYVRTKISNVTSKVTNKTIETTVKGIKLTKKSLTIAGTRLKNTKVGNTINKAFSSFGDTSLGKFGGKVTHKTKSAVRIIKSKKPIAKAAKATKTTGRILSSPARLLTKTFDKINVFRKWVAIILGVIFLIYLLLLAIFFAWFGIMSAFGTDSVTGDHNTIFAEIFNSYIVYHKENKMKADVAWIQSKEEEVIEKATEIGEGDPFNDEVYEGHHIDKYGSPDKEKGYTINFYNANGVLLPNSSSNTKDVMAVAAAIAGNYIGTDDLDEVDNSEYFKMDRLIKDVYELMIYHDDVTGLPFTYEESEIYVCNHGCDNYQYYCNGTIGSDGMDDYNRFLMYKADGVGFYDPDVEDKITAHLYDENSRLSETIEMFGEATWENYVRVNSVTGKGCRRHVTSFEKMIYRLSDTDEVATYDTDQYDIDFADSIDDWLNGYYYYVGNDLYYMPPQLYRDYITCYDIEYYCNGDHLTKCCYGHKDIELKGTLYDVEYVIREGIYPDGVDGGAIYTEMCHKFREDGYWSCEGTCNMARNFKLGDWYDIYDILIEGAEFSTTPTLTYEQMQEILSAYDGDIEALRKDIIAYGLKYVGKITYEYGGKASCFGPDATFGTTTGDSKGRTNGLDCSGFLNYIIGSATGINVPIGTAYYASYPRKSERSLAVGDLGFIKKPGADGNHVAMYIGKNASGQRMWLECNSSQGACITTSTAYKYFLDPLAVSH